MRVLPWPSLCLLLLTIGGLHTATAAPAASFHIGGAVVQPQDWTVARLRQERAKDIQTIHYTLKGEAHAARCVSLLTLVQASQPRLNPHIKNHVLQFVVAVQGRDGYTADFSLAELMPDFGHRAAWMALDVDGKPLPDDGGPVELIVPDDAKPGRWVHAVTVVTVVDGAQPASGT